MRLSVDREEDPGHNQSMNNDDEELMKTTVLCITKTVC